MNIMNGERYLGTLASELVWKTLNTLRKIRTILQVTIKIWEVFQNPVFCACA